MHVCYQYHMQLAIDEVVPECMWDVRRFLTLLFALCAVLACFAPVTLAERGLKEATTATATPAADEGVPRREAAHPCHSPVAPCTLITDIYMLRVTHAPNSLSRPQPTCTGV